MKLMTAFLAAATCCSPAVATELPQVMLLGDSVRMSYQNEVRQQLSGKAMIVYPEENCKSSADLDQNIERYLAKSNPTVVCLNAGLVDILKNSQGTNLVPVDQYITNLKGVIGKIKAVNPNVKLIFVATTPVDEDKLAQTAPGKPLSRCNADIDQYNLAVKTELPELIYLDVNTLLKGGNYFNDFGSSLSLEGKQKIGKAIVGAIQEALPTSPVAKVPATESDKPVLLLLGDSIRMNYQGNLSKLMAGKYIVSCPEANCQSTVYLKNHFDELTACATTAEVITFNAGLHDAFIKDNGANAVTLEDYRKNLSDIIDLLRRKYPQARLYFVNTTPVIEERQAASPTYKRIVRKNTDVDQYNQAAGEIMNNAKIMVLDLHGAIRSDPEKLLTDDGIHLSKQGQQFAATFLVQSLTTQTQGERK